MERLPFDPKHVEPETPAQAKRPARRDRRFRHAGEAAELTVSQLAELIKSTLEQRISAPLRVSGEVSNLSRRGHWYFSLKDDAAVVNCVGWASSAARFGFEPKDGDEVVATGTVSHFPPQGRTQLYVTGLKPVGAGALELQFRQLCDQLRKLDYFNDTRKKGLPPFPRRIAVITSATGAALQDVIATAAKRNPAVGLVVIDVRVQGESAAKQIATAIRWVDAQAERRGIDAVLVTRGGGSMEDLWAFNERIVADATFECHLPLVAAIGHESDTTIIELVADVRAATPTQAAMLLVPDRADLLRQHDYLRDRLRVVVQHQVMRSRSHLEALARHDLFRRPQLLLTRAREKMTGIARELHHMLRHRLNRSRRTIDQLARQMERQHPHAMVAAREQRLAILTDRLHRSVLHRLEQRPRLDLQERRMSRATRQLLDTRARLTNSLDRQLAVIDPRHVLKRGFSYTTLQDGRLVRSYRQATNGTALTTHVADGTIRSIVAVTTARPRATSSSKNASGSRAQMDLFSPDE